MTEHLAHRWTGFWNGDTASAHDLLAGEFRIHFGDPGSLLDPDAIVGPQLMADYVTAYREERPGVTFVVDETYDAEQGFVMRWTVTIGARRLSGIDAVHVTDGKLTEVWSVTAPRTL